MIILKTLPAIAMQVCETVTRKTVRLTVSQFVSGDAARPSEGS
jgi:hypothetical protein